MFASEPSPRSTKAGLNVVGDEEYPLLGAEAARRGRKPSGGTTKPPSPWIGSISMQATWSAPTCERTAVITCSAASSAQRSGPVGHRYGYAMGILYTSAANGPNERR